MEKIQNFHASLPDDKVSQLPYGQDFSLKRLGPEGKQFKLTDIQCVQFNLSTRGVCKSRTRIYPDMFFGQGN